MSSPHTGSPLSAFHIDGVIASTRESPKRLYNASYKFIGHIRSLAGHGGGSHGIQPSADRPPLPPRSPVWPFPRWIGIITTKTIHRNWHPVGTLGILMPPSVTLVVFGIITGLSIGKLFLAESFPVCSSRSSLFSSSMVVQDQPATGAEGERSTWSGSPLFEIALVIIIS